MRQPFFFFALALMSHGCSNVSAYVTSGLPKATHMAWLKKMTVDICESPPGDLTPEMLKTTPQLMSAWANQNVQNRKKSLQRENVKSRRDDKKPSKKKKDHSVECALAVERLLKRLIDERRAGNPDAIATTDAYNCMLEGWARSGEGGAAAERCEQILLEMEEHFIADGDKYLQPNYDSFRHVLMAWKESGESYAAPRAQRVLEWMIRLYKSHENDLAVPDADLFDIVLQLWAKSDSKEAPRNAEKLLGMMERLYETTGLEGVKPRTSSFNAVLFAWSKSSYEKASARASAILGFMVLLSQAGNSEATPDIMSYSAVVNAMAKSGKKDSARMAENLLKRIENASRSGVENLEPDTILYNTVMACSSRSRGKSAYRRTRAILDQQIRFHQDTGSNKCRPDVYGFTSVISSCAMASGSKSDKKKAFGVALATFQQLRNSDTFGSPNHVTYGTMLKACAKLLPVGHPLREKWVRTVFSECVKEGMVGDMVVSRLREAACSVVYKELMQGASRRDLPPDWTRNVIEKRDIRRKASRPRKTAEV